MERLGFADTKALLLACLRAGAVPMIWGPPGIGKSDLVQGAGDALALPLAPLYLSQCASEDVGGVPVPQDDGSIKRIAIGPIARACREACLVFLDELPDAPPHVQGSAQSLILTGWAGDSKLHPGSRVICAGNPADSASGGFGLTGPVRGRVCNVTLAPTIEEVIAWFAGSFGAPGSPERALGVDFAATLEASPGIVQIDPPSGAIAEGRSYGAPRNWARGLAILAELANDGIGDASPVAFAALSGCVGPDSAGAYLAIRRIRTRLPSLGEIRKDPAGALLPVDLDTAIGALGLIAVLASEKDSAPAWIYVARMGAGDLRVAATRALMRGTPLGPKAPPAALKARVLLMGDASKVAAGRG